MTASSHIEIRGARENNLRDVDVDIPKGALTVVTGVSGSGKSSLVFDTLAAESQRQLNETFSTFAQTFLPDYGHPDVDHLAHLPAVIVVDQTPLAGGPRSTVGTATDVGARLRLLYSRIGTPSIGHAKTLSFNDPLGMCPGCDGLGTTGKDAHQCPQCRGTRLSELVRSCRIDGYSIADLNAMQADELLSVLRLWDVPEVTALLETLREQVGRIIDMGLGYLSLERATATLSGGESQRVKMVRHLGSALSDLLYIFDEPTVGLHPRDVSRLGELILALRDNGNTVVVVEHDPAVMEIADHVIDLGPGAGRDGGQVTFAGEFWDLVDSRTRTGDALRARVRGTRLPRPARGYLRIEDATTNNLQHVTVDLPLGVLTAVTGVAGSGKTSLLLRHLPLIAPDDVVVVDQSPLRGSRRSSLATYSGLLSQIRTLFARTTGAPAAMFSPSSAGGCPSCRGTGVVYSDRAFMGTVASRCAECEGRRFTREAMAYRVGGRSIADVLEMTVTEALTYVTELEAATASPTGGAIGITGRAGARTIIAILRQLVDVGLDYLALGQMLATLSGGERQRLKLAAQLIRAGGGTGTVYVLDEPTAGLHMADVGRLIDLLDQLVADGATVIVIEHNLDVVAAADWVIDLGPESGGSGGRVMFEGTPEQLMDEPTHTGEYLHRYLTAPVR